MLADWLFTIDSSRFSDFAFEIFCRRSSPPIFLHHAPPYYCFSAAFADCLPPRCHDGAAAAVLPCWRYYYFAYFHISIATPCFSALILPRHFAAAAADAISLPPFAFAYCHYFADLLAADITPLIFAFMRLMPCHFC